MHRGEENQSQGGKKSKATQSYTPLQMSPELEPLLPLFMLAKARSYKALSVRLSVTRISHNTQDQSHQLKRTQCNEMNSFKKIFHLQINFCLQIR